MRPILVVILSFFVLFLFCFCKQDSNGLLRYKNIQYLYLFNEISIGSDTLRGHYIFVKDIGKPSDISGVVNDMQEFAICYARSHFEVNYIYIVNKKIFSMDDLGVQDIKFIIYFDSNEVKHIKSVRQYDKGFQHAIPPISKPVICN